MGTGAVSRYKVVSEPEICHGAEFKLRADERIRVQRPLQIYLGCRSKAKSMTNNLPILSVLVVRAQLSYIAGNINLTSGFLFFYCFDCMLKISSIY